MPEKSAAGGSGAVVKIPCGRVAGMGSSGAANVLGLLRLLRFPAEFETIAEASRVVCIDRKGIRDVICGRQKTAGGFFWKAIEQD